MKRVNFLGKTDISTWQTKLDSKFITSFKKPDTMVVLKYIF